MTKKRETVTIELEGDEEMRTPAFDRECENVRLMNSKSARVLGSINQFGPGILLHSASPFNNHIIPPCRFQIDLSEKQTLHHATSLHTYSPCPFSSFSSASFSPSQPPNASEPLCLVPVQRCLRDTYRII